jgi:hypothetical protein
LKDEIAALFAKQCFVEKNVSNNGENRFKDDDNMQEKFERFK